MDKFEDFKQKEKFVEDKSIFYPGIGDPALRPILSEKVNQAADDFRHVSLQLNPNDKDYQDKIQLGLARFEDIYLDLDTEDRERVCHYFEELMHMVGLESSGGQLNIFLYGFNPDDFKK